MALPNHNANISIENQNFRQIDTDVLHGIWHRLNKPTSFYPFVQCDPGAGNPIVISIMTINNKTGVPIVTNYFNYDGTPYVGDPSLIITCP
jgi:hypothetical protein